MTDGGGGLTETGEGTIHTSALSPPPPGRGGAGHDSTLRQCIALGNVGTCMETAEISAYVHNNFKATLTFTKK